MSRYIYAAEQIRNARELVEVPNARAAEGWRLIELVHLEGKLYAMFERDLETEEEEATGSFVAPEEYANEVVALLKQNTVIRE